MQIFAKKTDPAKHFFDVTKGQQISEVNLIQKSQSQKLQHYIA